jgi:hypothetical protein
MHGIFNFSPKCIVSSKCPKALFHKDILTTFRGIIPNKSVT